ncbi:MAG: integration host factor subunit alpha [Deltaproteobacteria bacterium]|nr:MAG: integration host factor subunit alpha [Deltaproteobacteria bacterium]
MTKSDLVEQIQSATGLTMKESTALFDTVMEIMKATLERGEAIKVSRFGSFEVRAKSARRGRDPQTGKELTITPRRILSFRPSNMLKQMINTHPAQSST